MGSLGRSDTGTRRNRLYGTVGLVGATGATGVQGPAGPQGKQGQVGKVTVICKVKGSKKVTYTVKIAKASAGSLRWTLRRGGHLVSHGITGVRRLQRVLNGLGRGRYVLWANGQRTCFVVGSGVGLSECSV